MTAALPSALALGVAALAAAALTVLRRPAPAGGDRLEDPGGPDPEHRETPEDSEELDGPESTGESRRPKPSPALRDAAVWLALTTAAQALHFTEEATMGFHARFGPLLGVPPMRFDAFAAFNAAWLVLWVVSVPGVRRGRTPAFFAAWFLAVAGTANGLAHPALALVSRGYFPGVVTAPVVGAACAVLGLRLLRATEPRRA